MGMEESKLFPTLRGPPIYPRGISETMHNSNPKPWERVYQGPVHTWYKRRISDLNFVHHKVTCPTKVTSESGDCSAGFCMTTQTLIELPKGGPFQLRKRAKRTKMAEHFEYNHIPAHVSSIQNFHLECILCHRNALVILHLSRNHVSQFGAVDLHANKFLGVFGRQRADYTSRSVAGELSPDECLCLLRLTTTHGVGETIFQLYDIRSHVLLSEIHMANQYNHFTFDPRFSHSRVIISDSFQAEEESRPSFQPQQLRELHFNQQNQAANIGGNIADIVGAGVAAGGVAAGPHNNRHQSTSSLLADGQDLVLWNCVSWQRLSGNMRPLVGLPLRQVAYSALRQLCYTPSGHLLVACYVDDRTCRCNLIGHSACHSPSSSHRRPNSQNLSFSTPSHEIFSSASIATTPSHDVHVNRTTNTNHHHQHHHHHHKFAASNGHHRQIAQCSSPGFIPFYQNGTGSNNSARSRRHFSVSAAAGSAVTPSHIPNMATVGLGTNNLNVDNATAPSGHLLNCRLIIFDSNAMHRLRMLEFTRLACPLHSCRVNFTPQFSRCGSRLMVVYNPASINGTITYSQASPNGGHLLTTSSPALESSTSNSVYNTNGVSSSSAAASSSSTRLNSVSAVDCVLIFQMPPPLTLKAIARESLLQVCNDDQVRRLPLPMELIDFLLFRPPYSCAGSCISRSSSSLTSHMLDILNTSDEWT